MEGVKTINIIRNAADFIEECIEDDHEENRTLLEGVFRRIESLYEVPEIQIERMPLHALLNEAYTNAVSAMEGRDLTIEKTFGNEVELNMDISVLRKIFDGLLKNAIENTPDQGMIKIVTITRGDEIQIDFRDHGVGIDPENHEMFFGGFFHTQDTEDYSSGRPYGFNAGGSGSDLLRMKVFSESLRNSAK